MNVAPWALRGVRISAFVLLSAATAMAFTQRIANIGFDLQWSTNIVPTPGWASLEDPQNAPFFSRTNYDAHVIAGSTDTSIFYRVRIYRP